MTVAATGAYPDADTLAAAGLRLEAAGQVLTVTLDRPEKRNAQTPAMWRALAAVGEAVGDDVRVVVLRAEGESFSAGLDRALFTPGAVAGELSVVELGMLTAREIDRAIEGFQAAFRWWRRPELVSVAAVQGHAIGAGFQLALGCDLRVVADDAQLAMRETSLGLVPDLGGTKPLVDAVGYSRALEICATGRLVDAGEARELGLATVVVPRQRLGAAVDDLVAALTEPLHGAVAGLKQLLVGAADRAYDDQLQAERVVQAERLRELARALQSP